MAMNKQKTKPRPLWEGVYQSFAEARGDDHVFEGEVWLGKAVVRASEALERSRGGTIPPVATTSDYALPFVAAAISRIDRPLRILDFGGGMATSYIPLRVMLPASRAIEYVVVENDAICREGKHLFASDRGVQFRTNIPTPPHEFDIVHFGSSLHYVDDWKGTLTAVAALNPGYLIFADLPAAENRTFVTTQNFHGQRIPVRFWNFDEFETEMCKLGYDLLLRARYASHCLAANGNIPTDNFADDYRLTYVVQCIFGRTGGEDPSRAR